VNILWMAADKGHKVINTSLGFMGQASWKGLQSYCRK